MLIKQIFATMVLIASLFLYNIPSLYSQTSGPSILKWEMHEITLSSTQPYANPFDGKVTAQFTSPSSQSLTIPGFYAGNNTWKIRFMGSEVGQWTYVTSSTDSQLNGQAGTIDVLDNPGIKGAVLGQIAPDPSRPTRWKWSDGPSFSYSTFYDLSLLTRPENNSQYGWRNFLNYIESQKMNGVMFNIHAPFVSALSSCPGYAPATGTGWPPGSNNSDCDGNIFIMPWPKSSDPNTMADSTSDIDYNKFWLPLWDRLDAIMTEMRDRNMIAIMLIYTDDTSFRPAEQSQEETRLFDYIIARLSVFPNIIFDDGIDIKEYRNIDTWVPWWQSYFETNDPYKHARSSRHGDDTITTATYASLIAKLNKNTDLSQWRARMDENAIDQNTSAITPKPPAEHDGLHEIARYDATQLRKEFVWLKQLMSGMHAAVYGHVDSYNLDRISTNNRDAGLNSLRNRNAFLEAFSVPWWDMNPDDNLIQTISSGNKYAIATADKSKILAYFDSIGTGSAVLDVSGLVGSDAEKMWVNPSTGQVLERATISITNSSLTLNSPLGDDAVFYIHGDPGNSDTTPPSPPTNLKVNQGF